MIPTTRSIIVAAIPLGLIVAAVVGEVPAEYRRKKARSAIELLSQGAEAASASAPTTRPVDSKGKAVSPFGKSGSRSEYALPGVVVYSDGRKVPGYIWTPSGKAWRIYERASKQFRDIPFDAVKRIDGHVEWERMEDDWRWREGGMDLKVYTGKKYPNRMTYFTFTLLDDRKIVGNIAQMFYVELAGRLTPAMLHKRHQGRIDQTLESMPYVKQVIFDAKVMREAMEEITSSRMAPEPQDSSRAVTQPRGRSPATRSDRPVRQTPNPEP